MKRWTVSLPNPDGYDIQPSDTTFHTPQEIVLAADHDAEIEFLELQTKLLPPLQELAEEQRAEIERLRSELDSFQRRFVAVDDVLKAKSREAEIERLREESEKYRQALWIATDDKRSLFCETERLRASERSAWNAAVERDEKIEKLKAENQVLAETITVIETLPEIVKEEKDEEIERLHERNAQAIDVRDAEIEQLRALLSAGLSFTTMNAEQARWKRQVAERLGLTDVLELYQ